MVGIATLVYSQYSIFSFGSRVSIRSPPVRPQSSRDFGCYRNYYAIVHQIIPVCETFSPYNILNYQRRYLDVIFSIH